MINKIGELKPYKNNAKIHTKKQVDVLAGAIKDYGFIEPIVVDKDNEIISGHGRLEAATTNDMTDIQYIDLEPGKVPVIRTKLSGKKANAARLASNQIQAMTGYDNDLLLPELQELSLNGIDIASLGFNKDLIIVPEEKDDKAPEAPKIPVSQIGDIFELGNHRVLCGDSTIKDDVEKLMCGREADMVFTDPPYGVDYVSRVDEDRRKNWGGIKNDDLKGKALQEFINDALGFHWKAKSRYVCCNWQSVKDFFDALGMPNSLIVWDKKSIGLGANYRSQHEFILFWGKLGTKNEGNVWSLKRDSSGEYTHPTQKPVELITRAITNSSKEGDMVFDSFLGSGSTLIACEKTGRTCYGIELDPKYVDVIVTRYCQYANKTHVTVNGKKMEWITP